MQHNVFQQAQAKSLICTAACRQMQPGGQLALVARQAFCATLQDGLLLGWSSIEVPEANARAAACFWTPAQVQHVMVHQGPQIGLVGGPPARRASFPQCAMLCYYSRKCDQAQGPCSITQFARYGRAWNFTAGR